MLKQLLSHYQILEKLGEGGMGIVYKARDTHLDRFVAIKVLPAEKVADPERKRRFVQEAKAASALNHPNIITIYDIDQINGVDFIAMEYVTGEDFGPANPEGLRLNEALKYAVQIANALEAAHAAGIIHRDLKPGNVMVSETDAVKVLDFGLAKLIDKHEISELEKTLQTDGDRHTDEGTILGTVSYMSPEQAEGKKVDARSDIFGFGASFSNYARDKGWGMGSKVGAIPSAVGGKSIALSHAGKVFEVADCTLGKWRTWLRHILRDQLLLWAPACVVGVALPAMVSYEFIRGVRTVEGHAAAAMTASAISARHGEIFWFLTLLCGFVVLFPSQISVLDSISRRWTDVIWMGVKRLHHLEGNRVKYVYYLLLMSAGLWGLLALRLTPNPLVMAVASGMLLNLGLGFSALHVLYVNVALLPRQLRPPWLMRLGLICCSMFYTGISCVAFRQQWPIISGWLGI